MTTDRASLDPRAGGGLRLSLPTILLAVSAGICVQVLVLLTLSGGDLEKPVTLRRVGPPTPRADTIPLPPPPPATERAWDC